MRAIVRRLIRRAPTILKRSGGAGGLRSPKSLAATLLIGFLVLAPPGTLIVGALAVAGFVGALLNRGAPDAKPEVTSGRGEPAPASSAAPPAARADEDSPTSARASAGEDAKPPRRSRLARRSRRASAARDEAKR